MSLTAYLNYDAELKNKLKRLKLPTPRINVPTILSSRGNDNKILGTSFDYGFRMILEQRYKNKRVKIFRSNPIFEECYKILLQQLKTRDRFRLVVSEAQRYRVPVGIYVKSQKIKTRLQSAMSRYRRSKRSFLENGNITKGLCKGLLFLANLDVFYRSGKLYDQFDNHSSEVISELFDLLKINSSFPLIPKNEVHLNPSFGIASLMVGGADADLILDDTIIEIKLTKDTRIERKFLYQLIGYLLLSDIRNEIESTAGRNIKELAIYFPRAKYLWKIKISEFLSLKARRSLKKWFRRHLEIPYNRQQKQLALRNDFETLAALVKSKDDILNLFFKYPKFSNSIESRFGFKLSAKVKKLIRIPKFAEKSTDYLNRLKQRDLESYNQALRNMQIYLRGK